MRRAIQKQLRRYKDAIYTRLETAGLKGRRSFAANDLDIRLASIIGESGGFFIEAGANDGLSQSNTLYFERYFGWRGILIEPVPALAEQCRRNRPKAVVINGALVPPTHPGRTIQISYFNLMSVVDGAHESPDREALHAAKGACSLKRSDSSYRAEVPAFTLSEVLDNQNITRIDLLTLDVEGYEAPALKGLDLSRHRPRYILVEANYPEDIEGVLQFHYELAMKLTHHDRLYWLRDDVLNPGIEPQTGV